VSSHSSFGPGIDAAMLEARAKHRFIFSDPASPQAAPEEGDVITYQDSKPVQGGECVCVLCDSLLLRVWC
jgi:hypothetical protein